MVNYLNVIFQLVNTAVLIVICIMIFYLIKGIKKYLNK